MEDKGILVAMESVLIALERGVVEVGSSLERCASDLLGRLIALVASPGLRCNFVRSDVAPPG